ncbi:MAG: metallophosphoesterase [Bdellovibrionales bacterium]
MRKNRYRRFSLVTALTLSFFTGCYKPDFQLTSKRFNKSLDGSLNSVADIDPTGTNNFSFAIFGDVHMGTPVGNSLLEAIQSSKSGGDQFAILNGDITDSGKASSYDELVNTFAAESFEFRTAIGNHDIYFNGWDNFKNKIGRSTYSFQADNVFFAVIDTANGLIGAGQLAWLEETLESNSSEHKVIVTHFSPYTGKHQSLWRLSSDEESAMLKDIAFRTNVDLVIGGHMHGYLDRTIGGVRYIVTGGTNKIPDLGSSQHYVRVTISGTNLNVQKINY